MNYRHAYHAGNHADVLKHVVLSRLLVRMEKPGKPMAFLDTHAGVGVYDLMSVEAGKTLEWQAGVGLMGDIFDSAVEALLEPYRRVRSKYLAKDALHYPGSPAFAAALSGAGDRLIFNELHPIDHKLLEQEFGGDKRVQVMIKDASEAVRSRLPFLERRGVVLVDPAFEVADETVRTVRLLKHALKRMPSVVLMLWYPLKGSVFAQNLVDAVMEAKPPNLLQAEMQVREAFDGGGLAGSGLLIVNAPWQLDHDLQILVPALAERLGIGNWRRGQVNWLVAKA
jgi:23S rRNA (adenine2030-N6)-methyltransferase